MNTCVSALRSLLALALASPIPSVCRPPSLVSPELIFQSSAQIAFPLPACALRSAPLPQAAFHARLRPRFPPASQPGTLTNGIHPCLSAVPSTATPKLPRMCIYLPPRSSFSILRQSMRLTLSAAYSCFRNIRRQLLLPRSNHHATTSMDCKRCPGYRICASCAERTSCARASGGFRPSAAQDRPSHIQSKLLRRETMLTCAHNVPQPYTPVCEPLRAGAREISVCFRPNHPNFGHISRTSYRTSSITRPHVSRTHPYQSHTIGRRGDDFL